MVWGLEGHGYEDELWKLNLVAVSVDWSRKGERWGGQLGSREDVEKT